MTTGIIVHRSDETIFRYDIPITDDTHVMAPYGARWLPTVERSDRMPYGLTLWAIVRPDQPPVISPLIVRGTGHELGRVAAMYVGTCAFREGLVWHVFSRPQHTPPMEDGND